MLYEYALDPELVVDVAEDRKDFRLLLRGFEAGEPRVISDFPSFKVFKKRIESCAQARGLKGTAETRLDELLSFIKLSPKVRRDHEYSKDDPDWTGKITLESARVAFDTVLVKDKATLDLMPRIDIDDCYTGDCEHWDRVSRIELQRDAAAIAQAFGNMLRLATHVCIIDPYIGTRADKWNPFIAMLEAAVAGRVSSNLDVTVYFKPSAKVTTAAEMKKQFERENAKNLSAISKLQFLGIEQKTGHQRFHNRYILTDIGGVFMGDGLEEGTGNETDDVSILSREQYAQRWRQYTKPGTFQPVNGQKANVQFS